ncbi:hypothetical protein WICMUC_002556 [Wickerhamomyces mucosus]|uniref:Nitrogen permease regulator 2 n=1 Tax=Wickerhamomyces mucosus TaxID=1378264 RepID=A0A9P8PQE5_9ASCO|nr:hypothetical protein WICMUC_002556 [Wickerhamomyces mucosus]
MNDFEAIFYTVFHPTEGTKILHQVPENCIISESSNTLFDFDLVKNYIIPKSQLCDRLLTVKIDQYKLVGYPVSINAPHYTRNSFSFNFCFVFNYENKSSAYESSIRRLGRIFKNLEEQYQILSKLTNDMIYFKDSSKLKENDYLTNDDLLASRSHSIDSNYTINSTTVTYNQILSDLESHTNSSTPIGTAQKDGNVLKLESVESLIQQIYQDLNNYSECLIPIDSGNSVDIKLFPQLPPPPRLNPEDVPISMVNLEGLVDVNWDPAMLKILPYINGINSIKRISVLANSDYVIVKTCIQHLLYYKCIIITDIFQFSNIYAPTSSINLFLTDSHMALECQAYVVSPSIFKDKPFETPLSSNHDDDSISSSNIRSSKSSRIASAVNLLGSYSASLTRAESIILTSKSKLFYLYRSLHQGQTVKNWYKEHSEDLKYIDVRRFLSFGVLRGLIYRVHSYPIIDSVLQNENNSVFSSHQHLESLFSNDNFRDDLSNRRAKTLNNRLNKLSETQRKQVEEVKRHLRASKNFDAICTDLEIDRKVVDQLLRAIGPYNVINS